MSALAFSKPARLNRRQFLAALGALAWQCRLGQADTFTPLLKRGVNLSTWFQYTGEMALSAQELRYLHSKGFDHVRLPVDPLHIGWTQATEGTLFTQISGLDKAIQAILDAGLNLILDFHPTPESLQTQSPDQWQQAWIKAWTVLAYRYGQTPAERVVFEPLNEPHRIFRGNASIWRNALEKAVSQIRAVAPSHWLMVSGVYHEGSTLQSITPLQERNVLYSFHFYWPYEITHMGADWDQADQSGIRDLRGIHYPAVDTPAGALDTMTQEGGKSLRLAQRYLADQWNSQRLAQSLLPSLTWQARHQRPIYCSEFGTLGRNLDPASRQAWLRDVRQLLETHDIGWCVWDLGCNFNIARPLSTDLTTKRFCVPVIRPIRIDETLSRALGLTSTD